MTDLPPTAPAGLPSDGGPVDTNPADLADPRATTGRRRGGLFHHHDFRQLWAGDTVSQFGTQLAVLALPVLAVRTLGATEFQMGVLAALETIAFLVIGLPAGAWVDRWRKRHVLVIGDLVRAVTLLSLPVAWYLDALTLGHMYVVAVVVGVATVFFDVAYQSYLPELVPSDKISEGNAKLQASQSVAMVGGPAIAGFLIKAIGAPLTIVVDALSFVCSAVFVRRIRTPDSVPDRSARRDLLVEIGEGLGFVLKNQLLVRITACTSISNFFSSMSGALLVLFALRDLQIDEATLGIAFAFGSVGALLGALSATTAARIVGEGRLIPVSSLLWIPSGVLLPLAGAPLPAVPTLTVHGFLVSFAIVLYNVTQVSFRQRLCPKPLLGRMNASIRFVVWGTMPIGAFIGGILGQAYGIRTVLWISVAGAAISALPVLFSPLISMRDMPRELDQHA